MNKNTYAILNAFLNLLPPYGAALDWRGWLARKAIRQAGERLRVSSNVVIYNPDRLTVGNHVYIGYNTYIGGGDVILDDEVIIGPFCCVVAGNHTMRNGSFRYGPYEYGNIHIGRGTWLGAHATVTAGVTIGAGCLVAANAVVTHDMPDFSFIAGVPARVVRKLPAGGDCREDTP